MSALIYVFSDSVLVVILVYMCVHVMEGKYYVGVCV